MGERGSSDLKALVKCVQSTYIPNKVMIVHHPGEDSYLAKHLGVLSSMRMQDGRATAYVCENYTCASPITDVSQLERVLDGRKKV